MAIGDYDEIVTKLQESAGNIRCTELRKMLERLGFVVTEGSKGNHRTYRHPGIPSFAGGNYDCGHGPSAQLKKFYIRNVLVTIQQYEEVLKA